MIAGIVTGPRRGWKRPDMDDRSGGQGARPDAVLVVGDVNSTLPCSIVARKLNIPVAHVEAGLRSGDMTMPEEINRLVTDSISDGFFVTEPSGVAHLRREGKADSAIFPVG